MVVWLFWTTLHGVTNCRCRIPIFFIFFSRIRILQRARNVFCISPSNIDTNVASRAGWRLEAETRNTVRFYWLSSVSFLKFTDLSLLDLDTCASNFGSQRAAAFFGSLISIHKPPPCSRTTFSGFEGPSFPPSSLSPFLPVFSLRLFFWPH